MTVGRRFPLHRMLWALVTVCGMVANAETAAVKLVPGVEFATARMQPGTLSMDAQQPGQNPLPSGLHIDILKGDRGVNVIKKNTAVTPVVEVKDRNNLPVAGALVLFSSPTDGPSVKFVNGERSFSATTDAKGQASAEGLKPLNTGSFEVTVSAKYQDEVANATILMTNVLTAVETGGQGGSTTGAASSGMSHTTIAIIVGVAVAAAAGIGIALATHGGGSSTSSSTVSIGVGSGGSAGAPH